MKSQKKSEQLVEGTRPGIERRATDRAVAAPQLSGDLSFPDDETHTQLLLLPDGRLYVHNLTPAMAQILQKLDPQDQALQQRMLPATAGAPPTIAP